MPNDTPSLTEIESKNIDPQLGTGQPAVTFDDSKLLDSINQNAQFKADNDWRKYQQFLTDYQDRLKNQQDIADKAIADSDREYLKKQSVDLFKDALDNPYQIYNPEFNTKLASIRAEAVSSKQARDFAEKNAEFLVTHPEFNTPENKAIIKDYIDGQTVEKGGRKVPLLNVPDVFDSVAYFGQLRSDPRVKEMINANRIDEQKGLTFERQDTKYKYKPFLELIKLGYESKPEIQRIAKRDFEALPPNVKSNFEDPRDYWVNFGSKHFGGFDDVTEQGKEVIQAYNIPLQKAELAERAANNRANRAIEWAKINLAKEAAELKGKGEAAQNTWLNNITDDTFEGAIKNKKEIYTGKGVGVPKKLSGYEADISNPTLALFGYEGTMGSDNKKAIIPPDKAVVSPDGKTITFKFYKRIKGTNNILKQGGNSVIDEDKTKTVSKEEFKGRLGKDILGVKTLSTEIYPYGGGAGETQTVTEQKPAWAL